MLLAADVFISEFSASNAEAFRDGDREYPDWIELYNAGDEAADLTGWYLTDNQDNLTKWTFPSGTIGPGEFLTVFASGKDEEDRRDNLHTNFRLSRAGEYLALVQPDATTIQTEFAPNYPEQLTDIPYGIRMGAVDTALVSTSTPIQLLIPEDNRHGLTWRSNDFLPGDDWLTVLDGEPITAAIGFETDSGFAESFSTDVSSIMKGVNASAYVRIPFQIDDPSEIHDLALNLKYDDGVSIAINGTVVELREASFFSSFNSVAESERDNAEAVQFETIALTAHTGLLVAGDNVLTLHSQNISADDSDFLLAAELIATVDGIDRTEYGYLTEPTPNAPNTGQFGKGPRLFGPSISEVAHAPLEPTSDQPMTVTAKIERTFQDVASVELLYRVMYANETRVTMTDDGQGVDAVANDGLFSAQIPGGIANQGEMIRYYVLATDAIGNDMRLPTFTDTAGNDQSPEYFGTVVQDPSFDTTLPVFHWFSEQVSRARSRASARVSIYYAGEFYDNARARQRGGATNGSSQKFTFNDEQPFYVNEKLGRVSEFNMNAQGGDSTYVRQPMAFQTYEIAGNETSESFFMAMRVNGERDRSGRPGIFIEQVDEDYVDRHGYNSDGALYKFVQRSNLDPVFADTTTGIEKKTRLDEGFEDIQAVVDGLTLPTQAERGFSVFDNFNVAQVMNYLAIRSITLDADDVRKNFYLYRDTEGTGQWSIFPWDKDWTFGVEGDGGQFLHHPFFADEAHRKDNANQWNRLYDAVFNDPVLSEMYLRRLRTVMDEVLQPPGTENGILEQLADDIAASADGTIPGSINAIKSYLTARREELYNDHVVDPEATGEIKELIPEFANGRFFVPTNNDLGQTWTGIDDPANIADWGSGQTGYGFASRFDDLVNTQVTPLESCDTCTSIYARIPFDVADASAVKRMTLQMKYDDGFIAYLNGVEVARTRVTGDISFDMDSRSHSNREALEFENFNISDNVGLLQNGRNVLAIQVVNSSPTSNDMLVLPRLVDGVISNQAAAGIPLAQVGTPQISFGAVEHNPDSNQDQEYIELRNENSVAVDISGWRIEGGVQHTFPAGTVIPSGRSLYLSPNAKEFLTRETGPSGGQGLFVQGNYDGHLSNFGETISLIASDGQTLDTFTTPINPTDVQRFLRLSEVHYNPSGPSETTEFVEVTNTSSTVTLDLTGVKLTGGPETDFSIPDGTMLGPGHVLVIASDRDDLIANYLLLADDQVVGNYVGNLSNGGERIKLDDVNGSTIDEFTYDDADPWPVAADGGGMSLVRISTAVDADDAANWAAGVPNPGSLESIDTDLNRDGIVTPADIDFACSEVALGRASIDLDQDGTVNLNDVTYYVERLLGTSAGDANLDGVFDSTDLVTVFRSAKYELNDGTATWIEGDWNCDGNFGSSDLVAAFRAGRYVAAATPQSGKPTQASINETSISAALVPRVERHPEASSDSNANEEKTTGEPGRPAQITNPIVVDSAFVRSNVADTERVFAERDDLTDDLSTDEHFT